MAGKRVKFRGAFKGTAEINLGKIKKGGRKIAPRPKPGQKKWQGPAQKRVHITTAQGHEMVARVPVKQHLILDVQKGQSAAVRGPGVRGPTAEEMCLLFGKPLPKRRKP